MPQFRPTRFTLAEVDLINDALGTTYSEPQLRAALAAEGMTPEIIADRLHAMRFNLLRQLLRYDEASETWSIAG